MTDPAEDRDETPSEEPIALAIDAATGPSSVAVLEGERRLAGELGPSGRDTDRWIFEAIRRCLESADRSRGDLDLLAVTTGPGAFTGIRVGISTALGLATPAGIPVAGVGILEALAETARTRGRPVLACHDARRRQVYAAIFEIDGPGLLPLEPAWGPEALGPRDLLDRLGRADRPAPVAVGSGLDRYPELAVAVAETVEVEDGLAAAAGRLAVRTHRRLGAGALPPPRPFYLRPADVRIRPSPLARRRRRSGN